MLEEEELLEYASETGYRLCSRTGWKAPDDGIDDAWNGTFSATFDPNDHNKLFVCSQNGQLKVVNAINDEETKEYHVLFRRFTPTYEGSPAVHDKGKVVPSHWDKLVVLPNRPGEIIFLMGVSKTILYTVVPGWGGPYPPEPMLARTTRSDSSEFIYGTAILELYQHTCRVTSLATSDDGHLLASGDEQGQLHIATLCHYRGGDSTVFVPPYRPVDFEKEPMVTMPLSPQFDVAPNRKITIVPHRDENSGNPGGKSTLGPGPLFSLQWLPGSIPITTDSTRRKSQDKVDTKKKKKALVVSQLVYYLASGSIDRAVRISKITVCKTKGLSVTPAFVLNTVTTHVLSLHASLVLGENELISCMKARSRLYEDLQKTFQPAVSDSSSGGGPHGPHLQDDSFSSLLSTLEAYLAGTLGEYVGGGMDDDRSLTSRNTARSRRSSAIGGLDRHSPQYRLLKVGKLFRQRQQQHRELQQQLLQQQQQRVSMMDAYGSSGNDGGEGGMYLDVAGHASTYLAAGTHSGCVYVWKFHQTDLESAAYSGLSLRSSSSASSGLLSPTGSGTVDWDDDDAMTHASHTTAGVSFHSHVTGRDKDGSMSAPIPGPLADDGKKLHSLLQSSQHPVVQVSLSAAIDPDTEVATILQPATTTAGVGGGGAGVSSSASGSVFVEGHQRVVLAAADTQSCVRTHCETDVITDDDTFDIPGVSGISGISGGGFGGVVTSMASVGGGISNGNGIGGGPITLCGESSFPAPVVACTFHEPLSAVTLLRQYRPRHVIEDPSSGGVPTSDVRTIDEKLSMELAMEIKEFLLHEKTRHHTAVDSRGTVRNSEREEEKTEERQGAGVREGLGSVVSLEAHLPRSQLLVCALDGKMQMFPSDELVALSVLRKGQQGANATLLHTSANNASANANNASGVFFPDQGRDQRVAAPGYSTSPSHHPTSSALRASGPGLGPTSSSSQTHMTPPRMRVGEGMGVGESGMDSPLPPTRGAAAGQGLGLGGDIHSSPPPHRTPSSVAALRSSQSPSGNDLHDIGGIGAMGRGVMAGGGPVGPYKQGGPGLGPGPKGEGGGGGGGGGWGGDEEGLDDGPSPRASPSFIPERPGGQGQGQGPSLPGSTTPTSSRHRRTGSGGDIKGSGGKGNDLPVRVLSPYPMSPLATPALHSSKLIHQQLTALTKVLGGDDDDDDEDNAREVDDEDIVSVGTVDTTDTDRRAAARMVTTPLDLPRYKDLVHLSAASSSVATDRPTNKSRYSSVAKQVDPAWLARRQYGGPSPADLQLLHPSDPLVTLTFNQKPEINSVGGGNGAPPPRNPLHSSVDPSTLLPSFRMEIGADEVFGPMDAFASWSGGGGGGGGGGLHHDKEKQRQARRIHQVLAQTGRAMVKTATMGEPTKPFAEYSTGSMG